MKAAHHFCNSTSPKPPNNAHQFSGQGLSSCLSFTLSFSWKTIYCKLGQQKYTARTALGSIHFTIIPYLQSWNSKDTNLHCCSLVKIIKKFVLIQLAHRILWVYLSTKLETPGQKWDIKRPHTHTSSLPKALNVKEINGNYRSCRRSLKVAKEGAEGTLVPRFSNWLCMLVCCIFPSNYISPAYGFSFCHF